MPTSFLFNQTQLDQLAQLRNEALARGPSAVGAFASVYQYVLKQTILSSVPATDPLWTHWPNLIIQDWVRATDAVKSKFGADAWRSVIWLVGASGVNEGNGVFSKMIREYNQRQCDLRGVPCDETLLQTASNKVGEYFANQILNPDRIVTQEDGRQLSVPNDGQGKLPTVQEIGNEDLNGVRDTLFPGNERPGSEYYLNQTWPGIVMLGKLGGQYTNRLLAPRDTPGQRTPAFNTVRDLRDILFAWDAFQYAFNKEGNISAYIDSGRASFVIQTFTGLAINTIPQLLSTGFSAEKWFNQLVSTQYPEAAKWLRYVSAQDSGPTLDMLRRSFFGVNLPATQGDASFLTNARALFNAIGDPEFIALRPMDAQRLQQAARSDFGAAWALRSLSTFALDPARAATVSPPFFAAWQADSRSLLSDSWLTDRSVMLAGLVKRNADNTDKVIGTANTDFVDLASGVTVAQRTLGSGLNAPANKVLFGGDGSDDINGTDNALGDRLYGMAGDDTLNGGGGNDYLEGGAGTDTYQFSSSFGKDTVIDADGLGRILIDGSAITTTQGAGRADTWTARLANGQTVGLALYSNPSSATGQNLVITRANSTDNTVTIAGFDRARAQSGGYLGIQLGTTNTPALRQTPGNFWQDANASLSQLGGLSATLREGGGAGFTVSLSQAARAGDVLTLNLAGLAGQGVQALIDGAAVNAAGARIQLTEGQTQVSFALLQAGGLSADAAGALSVSFSGAGQAASSTSNSYALTLKNELDAETTLTGDYKVKVEHNGSHPIYRYDGNGSPYEVVAAGEDRFVNDSQGNPVADPDGLLITDNVLYGTSGRDLITGLTGNDLLDGWDGDDRLDGGAGDDMIAGGAGSDTILGGEGNDFISSAGLASTLRPQAGPTDLWVNWQGHRGVGASDTVLAHGSTWGVYRKSAELTIWDGMLEGPADTTQQDVVDAGAGDDWVIASAGNDRVQGGSGDDELEGLGGRDMLQGGAGNDWIHGDGPVSTGHLDSTTAAQHGADWLDGGAGNDSLQGGGGDDQILGGSGNDSLWGDDGNGPESRDYLASAFGGRDWLDGQDGDDYLEGGASDDVLYGGAGADNLWGDRASVLMSASDRVSPLTWGQDQLDGGDGNDRLMGGGGADVLSGGAGDDLLWGDDDDALQPTATHGADRLDGGAGNDQLVGGGADDILIGGDGNDKLWGDLPAGSLAAAPHGDDVLDGGAGNDQLIAGGGNDTLYGGAGDDFLSGDDDTGSEAPGQLAGNDLLDGGEGNDGLIGGAGDDILVGGVGDDALHGGAGNDQLYGGDGNDLLEAQGGNDTLDGGSGNDLYYFSSTDGEVRISDAQGIDALYLRPGLRLEDLHFSLGSLKMDFGVAGNVLHLDGFDPADAANTSPIERVVFEGTGQAFEMAQLLQLVGFDIAGTDGDDTLTGTSMDDRLDGQGGNDVIDALEGDDTLLGGSGDDWLNAAAGNDLLDGGSGNDWLDGGDGDDTLDGGTGADTMAGGAGNDTYYVDEAGDVVIEDFSAPQPDEPGQVDTVISRVSRTLEDTVEDLQLVGTATQGIGNVLDNTLTGNEVANVLSGEAGNDRLWGGGGDDSLWGGDGDDTLESGTGNDVLDAGAGNDVLRGDIGAGGAVMRGGQGNDTYYLFDAQDSVVEAADSGTDTVVVSAMDYTLGDALENLTVVQGGTGVGNAQANVLIGDGFANVLRGLDGNDMLDGAGLYGTGRNPRAYQEADTLEGGRGDDTYRIWRSEDRVIERAGEGHDRLLLTLDGPDPLDGPVGVQPRYAFQMADEVEDLDAHDTQAQLTLSGNALANEIQGGLGSDVLIGGAGDDRLREAGAGNTLLWLEESDPANLPAAIRRIMASQTEPYREVLPRLYGVRFDLDGVNPADYVVLRGFDFDQSPTMYWPRATLPIDLRNVNAMTANPGADRLDGGDGRDWLDGGAGNDVLLGGAGEDVLIGGADGTTRVILQNDEGAGYVATLDLGEQAIGNDDWLDGGAGLDRMEGGTGNDTYEVDGVYELTGNPGTGINLCDGSHRFGVDQGPVYRWTADTVVELAGQGNDTVRSTASVVLDNVETVVLRDGGPVADLDATTGAGSQTLIGNAGRNRLDGGAGADVLQGGAGDDTYIVEAGDTVVEVAGEGTDTVRTTVDGYRLGTALENLVLEGTALTGLGNDADNALIGNAQANRLEGGLGNDILAGWRGNDTLLGGAGDDTYVFSRGDGVDTVIDSEGRGTLRLSGDIAWSDLAFSRSGNDLVVDVRDHGQTTGDRVVLRDWTTLTQRVDTVTFCDGPPQPLDFRLAVAPDANTASEDGKLTATGSVLTNDSGSGNTNVANPGVRTGALGTLTLAANGAYTYQLNNAALAVQQLRAGQTVVESFRYTATDTLTTPGSLDSVLAITVTGANDAPVLVTPLPDLTVGGGKAVSIAVPQGTFTDIDLGDVLTYSASMNGAALPSWLSFNASTRTFTGTAPATAQTLQLAVRATDLAGAWAQDVFELKITAPGVVLTGGDPTPQRVYDGCGGWTTV
jgi:VCBS repeat-containing protein